MDNYQLKNNMQAQRYEFYVGNKGDFAEVDYIKTADGEMILTHTGVPRPLSGQGIGSQMVEEVLKDIDEQGLKVVPQCPFIADYIRKNPRWEHIVAGMYAL